jgi:hypothetical protein
VPNISNISVPLHNPLDPYHHEFDNAPLKKLITRQELINGAVDSNTDLLIAAIGSAGTLANRLNQSLGSDGSLLLAAVDDVDHNIAAHVDGLGESSPGAGDSVSFVRMKQDERDKLSLIESQSNSLVAEFTTPSTTVSYTNGNLDFEPSDSISWHISNSKIYANTTFPATSLHLHVYNDTPVHANSPIDYTNYKVEAGSTPYISGSLRVHINGVRIFEDLTPLTPVLVPPAADPELDASTWTAIKFTATPASGTFVLSSAITSSDVIIIDWDKEIP